MDAMARRDQAPKSQDGNVANVKGSNGALAKNGPVAGLSTTASYSEQSSHNINLDGARAVASNKRKCMEPESSSSSNKRTLLVQSHEKTPRPTLVTHHTDPSDNGTQSRYDTPGNHIQTRLGKDQPLDIHDAADKKATKSAKSEAVKARVEDLKAERVAKGKTLAKLARKLHKQRKIAATQQEILENLVNENKRHYGLLNSVRESLNITNHRLSTRKNVHKDEVTSLKESIKFLKNGRILVEAVADEHTIELEELRKRLQILEERDLGAEDDVQKRASRLRDQINSDK